MESYLLKDLVPGLQVSKSESSDDSFKRIKSKTKLLIFNYSTETDVNYKYKNYFPKEDRKFESLQSLNFLKTKKKNKKIKNRSIIKYILSFPILFIILNSLYCKTDQNHLSIPNLVSPGCTSYRSRFLSYASGLNIQDFDEMEVDKENQVESPIYELDKPLNELSTGLQQHLNPLINSDINDHFVGSSLTIFDKFPQSFDEVSLLVLDTEGLAYRTDFSRKLIWATRLTEDLLRVKKPVSTRHEMCSLEDIARDNINKKKILGYQIFSPTLEDDKGNDMVYGKIKGSYKYSKDNTYRQDYKKNKKYGKGDKNTDYSFDKLKSHLVPSYDGYVYYVDDFNTKLLQVHVKDIVNYTPFYTPLLEGVYLEGSRNSLVISLDYETGTYITRHNREDDTKSNYVLNYFVNEGNRDQLHIGITNWSVKAYNERDHTQIWDFDWLEVGSVVAHSKNDHIIQSIKDSVKISSNRLFFKNQNYYDTSNNLNLDDIDFSSNGPRLDLKITSDNSSKNSHLVFPFPISALFAIFKSSRDGIYTVELVERVHIPPPPNFLYDSSVTALMSSSRKIAHKSLYVENGVIGVLDESKIVKLVDQNTLVDSHQRVVSNKLYKRISSRKNRLLLEDLNEGKLVSTRQNVEGIGVDQRGIIKIGSSIVKSQQKGLTKFDGSTDFLSRWWWLLISWVLALVLTPVLWIFARIRKSRKKVQEDSRTNEGRTVQDSQTSRTDVYDSKTDLYDSTDESNVDLQFNEDDAIKRDTKLFTNRPYKMKQKVQQNTQYTRDKYLNTEDEYSEVSIERKLSIDEKLLNEVSNEIRRVRSEGYSHFGDGDFPESVWMEEQSLISVFTNNTFKPSKKRTFTKLFGIQPLGFKPLKGLSKSARATRQNKISKEIRYQTQPPKDQLQSTKYMGSSVGKELGSNGTKGKLLKVEKEGEIDDRDKLSNIKNLKDVNQNETKEKEEEDHTLSVIPDNSVLSKFLENGRFLRTFECIKMLGKGGFGSVYRARHKLEPGNPIYAIKFVLLKLKASEDLSSRRYFREVAANRDIYSKYVVRYYTWWCEEPHFLPLAQMSNQLQMAAINNLRYLVQNDIIPQYLINPSNNSSTKFEKESSTEKHQSQVKDKIINNYIKQYRDVIYQYINNPKQDELFPNFSQITQPRKQNKFGNKINTFNATNETQKTSKLMSSLSIKDPKVPKDNNLFDIYTENSNILFKDQSVSSKTNENVLNNDPESPKEPNTPKYLKDPKENKNDQKQQKEEGHKVLKDDNKQYQVVLLILMEMCNGCTLRQWLNNESRSLSVDGANSSDTNKDFKLNRKTELLLFKQIIKGLRDIHKNCFIHRDLKPENIFVDDKNNLKIGDLGLVGFIQENHHHHNINTVKQHLLSDATQVSVRGQVIGTPGYTAPEGGANCTEKVDIYSAALILLELLCPRFNTVMERLETLEKFRLNQQVPSFIKEQFKPWYDLMVQMTDANPENRPSADQVYKQVKVILNS